MKLRLADLDDAKFLHDLRNDALTRVNSRTSIPVPWEEHLRWLAVTLADRERRLYIASFAGVDIGTGRLDFNRAHTELSLTIAPEHRGKGHARNIIYELVKLAGGDSTPLVAETLNENVPCICAFMREGFRVQHARLDGERKWLWLTKAR